MQTACFGLKTNVKPEQTAFTGVSEHVYDVYPKKPEIFLAKKAIRLLPNCMEGKKICIIYSKALLRDEVPVVCFIDKRC